MTKPNEHIVHAFFTDGLFGFAEIFLDSFAAEHGEDIKIVFSTFGLSSAQINRLESRYANLEIRNKDLDILDVALKLNQPVAQVKEWKQQIEKNRTTDENYLWKVYFSVWERYRSLLKLATEFKSLGYKYLLHSDIDVYFRKSLDNYFNAMKKHDLTVYKRPWMSQNGFILGAFIGITLTSNSLNVLAIWKNYIEFIDIKDAPRGFGQITLTKTYHKTKSVCSWGDLLESENGPSFSKDRRLNSDLWFGNSNQGKNLKNISVELFRKDFTKRMKIRDHWNNTKIVYNNIYRPPRLTANTALSDKHQHNSDQTRVIESENELQLPILCAEEIAILVNRYDASRILDYGNNSTERHADRRITLKNNGRVPFFGTRKLWGVKTIESYTINNDYRLLTRSYHGVVSLNLATTLSHQIALSNLHEIFALASRFVCILMDLRVPDNKNVVDAHVYEYRCQQWGEKISHVAGLHPNLAYLTIFLVKLNNGTKIKKYSGHLKGITT